MTEVRALRRPGRDAIWIAWQEHRRSRELASALGIELITLTVKRSALVRYTVLTWRTAAILLERRPPVLFVQNPSMLLAVLAGLLKGWFDYRLVVDRHTYYFRRADAPASLKRSLAYWMGDWSVRKADLTIVTNDQLVALVERAGGTALKLPDKVPELALDRSVSGLARPGRRPRVVVVSTFAADEPLESVFRAARSLEDTAEFHVTGKPQAHGRLRAELDSLPGNVHLAGFLPEAEYVELLGAADVVMVLTTLENCLTCGAYEAVSLGKAMILSSTRTIQSYFRKGAIYAAPDAESICSAVVEALQQKVQLERDSQSLRSELDTDWRRLFDSLEDRLDSWAAKDAHEPISSNSV